MILEIDPWAGPRCGSGVTTPRSPEEDGKWRGRSPPPGKTQGGPLRGERPVGSGVRGPQGYPRAPFIALCKAGSELVSRRKIASRADARQQNHRGLPSVTVNAPVRLEGGRAGRVARIPPYGRAPALRSRKRGMIWGYRAPWVSKWGAGKTTKQRPAPTRRREGGAPGGTHPKIATRAGWGTVGAQPPPDTPRPTDCGARHPSNKLLVAWEHVTT